MRTVYFAFVDVFARAIIDRTVTFRAKAFGSGGKLDALVGTRTRLAVVERVAARRTFVASIGTLLYTVAHLRKFQTGTIVRT